MKTIKIFLIILILFITSGCWNYRELNEMAIVGAIGIDYDSEAKEMVISAQIFNPKKSSSGDTSGGTSNESPIVLYKYKNKTIHEALRKMLYESSKKLYIGHLDVIIYGKTVTEEYMKKSFDFLFRDSESRKDFDLLVAYEDSAYNVLKIITPLETTPSANIKSAIQANSKNVGTASSVTYDNFVSALYQDGLEAVLPTIKIIRDKSIGGSTENINNSVSLADIYISNLAVFKNTKMIGILSEEESLGYNIIRGITKQTIVSFPCDNNYGYASIEVTKIKPKMKVKVENGFPTVDIEVFSRATFSEVNCSIDISHLEGIKELQNMAEKKLKTIIEETIKVSQEKFNSDIVGFGENLFRNNNKYWRKVKDDWYDIFPKIKYKVNIKLEIPQKGSTVNSYEEKLNDTKKR